MFEAAQDIFAGAQRTAVRKERTRHPYVLSGLMHCALCRRKMQASWNHGNPAEIKALVRELKDIVAVLAHADPQDKRAIYDELGVNLTYHPDGRVHVGAGARVLGVRVGGGT